MGEMTQRGERAFNGVHLRLEQDSPYVEMMGGLEASARAVPPVLTSRPPQL